MEKIKTIDDLDSLGCRYVGELVFLLNTLKGKKVLFCNYEDDYSGYVDVDVLLQDGKVFSYCYGYGSCSGCDEWEGDDLSSEKIQQIMLQEATIFDDIKQYKKWAKTSRKVEKK